MAVFRCKMCGGSLKMAPDKKTGTCEFCGAEQTTPTITDASVASMYEKASSLRRNNDYDAASDAYSKVLTKAAGDPESYWSMVLCKYGVEYVEDPGSKKRIPTVNRTQYASILDDQNYKKALQLASPHQREIYIAEATRINEIQRGILEVSKNESPYDVFISYKETDEYGRRTRDSVYAHEVYNELTRQGLKVFFAPVSLQHILGAAYEPHIFAALNSSRVMVVIGTSKEKFNAVWVKNEWSRYLKLIKEGKKKTLIPAYRDMDPYDLPPEFARLQALDMTKLGFMVDLVEGVKKLVDNTRSSEAQASFSSSGQKRSSSSKLLQRANIFLEDGDWGGAKDAINDILRRDPENGEAHFLLLMAQARVKNQEELAQSRRPISNYSAYRNVIKYGDDQLVDLVRDINNQISENDYRNDSVASFVNREREIKPQRPAENPRRKEIRECEARIRDIKSRMGRVGGKSGKFKYILIPSIIGYVLVFVLAILFLAVMVILAVGDMSREAGTFYAFIVFWLLVLADAIVLCRNMYKMSPKSSKGYIFMVIFIPYVAVIVCSIRDMILIRQQGFDSSKLSAEQNAQLDRLREQLSEEEMKLESLKR